MVEVSRKRDIIEWVFAGAIVMAGLAAWFAIPSHLSHAQQGGGDPPAQVECK